MDIYPGFYRGCMCNGSYWVHYTAVVSKMKVDQTEWSDGRSEEEMER